MASQDLVQIYDLCSTLILELYIYLIDFFCAVENQEGPQGGTGNWNNWCQYGWVAGGIFWPTTDIFVEPSLVPKIKY
jgi:hypothetical protein